MRSTERIDHWHFCSSSPSVLVLLLQVFYFATVTYETSGNTAMQHFFFSFLLIFSCQNETPCRVREKLERTGGVCVDRQQYVVCVYISRQHGDWEKKHTHSFWQLTKCKVETKFDLYSYVIRDSIGGNNDRRRLTDFGWSFFCYLVCDGHESNERTNERGRYTRSRK